MGKTSSQSKQKYNSKTYKQFKFSVRKDAELCSLIEQFQAENPQGLSPLIKELLSAYFEQEKADK